MKNRTHIHNWLPLLQHLTFPPITSITLMNRPTTRVAELHPGPYGKLPTATRINQIMVTAITHTARPPTHFSHHITAMSIGWLSCNWVGRLPLPPIDCFSFYVMSCDHHLSLGTTFEFSLCCLARQLDTLSILHGLINMIPTSAWFEYVMQQVLRLRRVNCQQVLIAYSD